MKRVAIRELLDMDAGTPAEITASLSDLSRINRWFGGIATTQSMVEHVAQKLGIITLSLLEVAAGNGEVSDGARKSAKESGVQLDVTLLDRAPSHLRNRSKNGSRAVAGDALLLPFADRSFDLVSCCLFAHHLSPEELLQFINESLRVCRVALLINDLVRHPIHLALVYAGIPLYQGRLTRHDAPASVKQAYTPREMKELLRQTQATRVELKRHFLFRMGIVIWK